MTDAVSPSVYVLARTALDRVELDRFLTDAGLSWRESGDASQIEDVVEIAGRICYLSFGSQQSARTNREYISRLIAQEHESVLEHVSWTFLLTGVSRAFTHQLVRHRAGTAFSQLSQQYHDEREGLAIEPSLIANNPTLSLEWNQHLKATRDLYDRLIKALDDEETPISEERERRRAIRSAARSILPEAAETKIVFTANARALRHILSVRGELAGDAEWRTVCALLLERLNEDAPVLFWDFVREEMPDGTPIVRRTAKDAT